VVDRWEDFLAMGEAWNHLVARSPQRDNPFLTHEWFQAWWEGFGQDKDLLILLLLADDDLIGIIPLMRFRARYHGMPVRFLSLVTNDHTNRADFIVTERLEECVGLVLEFLCRNASRWDYAEFNFLPADSPTVKAITEQAAQYHFTCAGKPSYRSPFVPLAEDWDRFYTGLDGHFRRNMKNREKRLAGLGAVEYEEYHDARGLLRDFLADMFRVGGLSWKHLEKSAIASTPALNQFYARLAELTHPKGWLSLHLLRVAGKPIAFHYSLRNDGVLYLLKTEYDMAYQRYSPGHQIQKRVLEACYARGMREFDFLGPDMPWKREWTGLARPHIRLLLFHRSLRSRLLAFLELQVKPALKRSTLVQKLRRGPVEILQEGENTPCD